jgi:hypothetical protein
LGVGRGSDADDACPETAASALGRFGFDADAPDSLAPHILQKFIPVGFGEPHEGQTAGEVPGNPWADPPGLPPGLPVVRRWPHFTQNNDPSRLVSPQLGQRSPVIFSIFR